jgi:hypothetical protein
MILECSRYYDYLGLSTKAVKEEWNGVVVVTHCNGEAVVFIL